jgi:hypothetical protein
MVDGSLSGPRKRMAITAIRSISVKPIPNIKSL